MKSIILVLCPLIFSSCTLIGLYVGGSRAYQITPVDKLKPEDQVRIILNSQIELKGEFVKSEVDTIYYAVESHPWLDITDTLSVMNYNIQYVEKYNGYLPWMWGALGFAIDYAVYSALRSSFKPSLNNIVFMLCS